MASHALEAPPTLMGLMMSCNDLPSTAVARPSTPPSIPARPASTWHSEVDTYTSAGSTAVGDSVVLVNNGTASGSVEVYDEHSQTAPTTPPASSAKNSSDSVHHVARSHPKDGSYVAITMSVPKSRAVSGWDRSDDDEESSQPGGSPLPPLRNRKLGHIISMSGLRKTLSQTDLTPLGHQQQRRPSRIRSAMSKVSRHWQQHFGQEQGHDGGRRPSTGTFEKAPPAATATAH
ncbi:hypothetical protein QBC47DRAFT_385482 [Echria macrotheca]|uniref:Uncharacterized protein n=1 Tax=Echria macrotheca TaxID=438768 RepID=A0AAJ0F857_9PEZI|nr:hypothetical protein QBC47DRAFT_385482 [Echria macrotheca]